MMSFRLTILLAFSIVLMITFSDRKKRRQNSPLRLFSERKIISSFRLSQEKIRLPRDSIMK